MARFTHILTGIPVGSHVVVKSCGRYAQFDEVVKSGAVGIVANRECYPIIVNIRPSVGLGVAEHAGNIKVRVAMDSPLVDWERLQARGGTFDVYIRNVTDFNPGKIEYYTPFDKRVGPWADVAQVRAPDRPETRVFNDFRCEGCGVPLDEKKKNCEKCAVQNMVCEHPRIGDMALKVCGNQLVPGYGACKEHLELMGVTIKKRGKGRPVKARTVEDRLPEADKPKRKYRTRRPRSVAPLAVCVVD